MSSPLEGSNGSYVFSHYIYIKVNCHTLSICMPYISQKIYVFTYIYSYIFIYTYAYKYKYILTYICISYI